jgi:peptide/nickel transport system ATP-binding protein
VRAAEGVDLEIMQGETLGVLGESGSGKTITALSVMGLVAAEPGVISGKIEFSSNGLQQNLLQDLDQYVQRQRRNGRVMAVQKDCGGWQRKTELLMRNIRGREIAMIFQDPQSSLNPFVTVGKQITEAIQLNTEIKNSSEARQRALYWLERVKIDSPRLRYHNHPYGLSGGMCQRVMLAMALAAEPSLLIADEPTTGLDATIQAKVVELLMELKEVLNTTTMLISHDMEVIGRLSDRVAVMYGGRVVESGTVQEILRSQDGSNHPYTAALLACMPEEKHIKKKVSLQAIEGDVIDTINIPKGCRFFARCNQKNEKINKSCKEYEPALKEISPGHWVRCWLYFDEGR